MIDLTITLIQPDLAWQDKKNNLLKFEDYFQNLSRKTDLIVLPEMFNTGFVVEPRTLAEDMNGPTLAWMAQQAAVLKCVITGSLIILEEGNYYNRLVWMQANGKFLTYDKRHLFHPGNEHEQFSQGSKKLIVDLMGWKICPLVCYDLRFPVWSKNTWANGTYEYDVLLYMANWPAARSFAYRQLHIARAIENQCYVIGVNRVGVDGKGTNHRGDSTVIDFKGKHLVEIAPDEEGMETLDLSYDRLSDFRKGFTVGMDWDRFEIEK
ncbi:MAG: nitrilase family protein [Bacteroidota bacterium]